MYQIETQTKTSTTEATEILCKRLTESLSSIHADTRLSTMLGLPADTMAELLAPLGILKGQGMDSTVSAETCLRLDMLLHTAKALGVVEEYAITKQAHCLGEPLSVVPVGVDLKSVMIELPSGWLVELDLPGASLASEEHARSRAVTN